MSIPFHISSIRDWLGEPTPSFQGIKVWETVVFEQYLDQMDWFYEADAKSIIARNSSRKFYIIDTETGLISNKIYPNFDDLLNEDKKDFNDMSLNEQGLCNSNPIVKQAYWRLMHNGWIHSLFNPSANYIDFRDKQRLRKTVYYTSIASKDNFLVAYLNKGQQMSLIEIHSMDDHTHIQTIDTGANGNHACAFIQNNSQLIVGSDDGQIRFFDIISGELLHHFEGHDDAVLSMDVNHDESLLVSASYDGIWKMWNLTPGDDFGKCVHTEDLLIQKYDRKIPIYRIQFSPDNVFIFITTDKGRLMIFHREELYMQTNIYDKYQSKTPSLNDPAILSLLIDSDEKSFYIGYANGRIQKWK